MKNFVILLIIVILVASVFGININPYYAVPSLLGEESIFYKIGQGAINLIGISFEYGGDIWDRIKDFFENIKNIWGWSILV